MEADNIHSCGAVCVASLPPTAFSLLSRTAFSLPLLLLPPPVVAAFALLLPTQPLLLLSSMLFCFSFAAAAATAAAAAAVATATTGYHCSCGCHPLPHRKLSSRFALHRCMAAANSKIDLRSELFLMFMFIPLTELWYHPLSLLLLISLLGK